MISHVNGLLMVEAARPLDVQGLLPRLALSAAIGLLIGAERGWRMREEEPGSRVAGVRTFTMLGLLGGLVSLSVSAGIGAIALIIAFGSIAVLLIGYNAEMRVEAHFSVTSAIAALTTMLLGALAVAGEMALASIGAGAMVAYLRRGKPFTRRLRRPLKRR